MATERERDEREACARTNERERANSTNSNSRGHNNPYSLRLLPSPSLLYSVVVLVPLALCEEASSFAACRCSSSWR